MNQESPQNSDVFEKIRRRREWFEKTNHINAAFFLGIVYSFIVHIDTTTTKVVFIGCFLLNLIGQIYLWRIYGLGTKDTSYKPKLNKVLVVVYSVLLISLIELFNWIEKA